MSHASGIIRDGFAPLTPTLRSGPLTLVISPECTSTAQAGRTHISVLCDAKGRGHVPQKKPAASTFLRFQMNMLTEPRGQVF